MRPGSPCDSMREAKIRHHRLLAEEDGRLIGMATGGNSSWSYDPQKFHIDVSVLLFHAIDERATPQSHSPQIEQEIRTGV